MSPRKPARRGTGRTTFVLLKLSAANGLFFFSLFPSFFPLSLQLWLRARLQQRRRDVGGDLARNRRVAACQNKAIIWPTSRQTYCPSHRIRVPPNRRHQIALANANPVLCIS